MALPRAILNVSRHKCEIDNEEHITYNVNKCFSVKLWRKGKLSSISHSSQVTVLNL